MTNYNELVDHLVSTMPSNSSSQTNNKVHANSPYNDGWTKQYYQEQSNNEDAPFDTQAYRNYKQLVDKEREKIDTNNITESLYRLGYKIDTLLSKIISQLDTIIEDDSVGENDTKG